MLKLTVCAVVFTILGRNLVYAEKIWNAFKVTDLKLSEVKDRYYSKLPRQESKAKQQGWEKLPGQCDMGTFLGYRYIKGKDISLMVLYDENGYVAGVQSGVYRNDVYASGTNYNYMRSPSYQLDVIKGRLVYLQTAYLVRPSIICRGGRTKEEYEEQGTGTGLFLQNGTNPIRDSWHAPLYVDGMDVTNWISSACYPTLGTHHWFNLYDHEDCHDFYPITLMYHKDKLNIFAFVHWGRYNFSDRFEYPVESDIPNFMPPNPPKCLTNELNVSGGYSITHVFLTNRAWSKVC